LLATLAFAGCEHKNKSEQSKDQSGMAKPGTPPANTPPANKPPTNTAPPTPVDPAPGAGQPSGDDVRPPVAADLAEYTKDLPGDGKLVATIETSMGTIHCELFGDKAPMTVANFVGLATGKKAWRNPKTGAVEKGKPFYDGLIFHRVIPEFMIQGGDPMGVGRGGPGYQFGDEFLQELQMQPGTLAMANAGPATNGSQFFITEVAPAHLNMRHTIFGQCKELDLVKQIARVPQNAQNKPDTDVTMNKVTISKMKSW
jgi:peptidyl-prolyl cis-trans isomerase A (cyclophilin A)